MLRLYNTLTRKIEDFKPLGVPVRFYSCGPTVYWFQHIGNLRTYLFNDVLKRTLLFNNFKVKHVMNVTDVGHLVSDADQGEDKMELAARKESKSAKEIADFYLKIFQDDLKKLNIVLPNIWSKATEHIPEQLDLILKLEKKGFTYKLSDGIYFDTSKLGDYGKMGGAKEGLEAGKRVGVGEKKNPKDFALWKFSSKNERRQQEWNSPWGRGFPGWHIECSAMSIKYLGDQFDIHTGGEDHIQVHHTNEIAQSEVALGKKPWVRYWLHGAFLTFKGEKVSKSKGGLYTLSELQKLGFEPLSFRYLCLNTQYHKPLAFSLEALGAAQTAYRNLKKKVLEFKENPKDVPVDNSYEQDFTKAVNDNLNTPLALSVVWFLVKDSNLGNKQKLDLLLIFDKILGLNLKGVKKEVLVIPDEVQDLVNKRVQARKVKNWVESDNLRKRINALGFVIEDSDKGVIIKKK